MSEDYTLADGMILRVACCVVTQDGYVHDEEALLPEYTSLRNKIGSLMTFVDPNKGPTVEVCALPPDATLFEHARRGTELLLLYEVPPSAVDPAAPGGALHISACLRPDDALESVQRDGQCRVVSLTWSHCIESPSCPEAAYLGLLRELVSTAKAAPAPRGDRTGTGTHSVFGRQVRFDIRAGLPLLTTKKLAWKKVVEELLWFARGETDAGDLQQRGVHIWDGNSSRTFLDAAGLHDLRDGDIGPGYGFQWRHAGAQYRGAKSGDASKYAGEGVDQLAAIEKELKANPFSRRLFMTAWNATDIARMALPPCHVSCQFYVSQPEAGGPLALSCHMYQRSVDTFLGFPWNIASYSALTHIMAVRCGMVPHELIISTGDTHLYANHLEAARTQLTRSPRPMPAFWVSPQVATKDWHEITIDDFDLCGYFPHPLIAAPMSV